MPGHPPSVLAGALALVLACTAMGCSSSASDSTSTPSSPAQPAGASGFDGAALPSPGVAVRDFTLTDQAGRPTTLSRLRGQVAIVAFPYSTCGAPCVVIAQQIRGALDELAVPVAVLMVSADPQADTRASVKRFLARASLTGRVRYLTGTLAQLRRVWRFFRVVPASAGRARFARFASVFLVDRAGRERVIYQLEQLTPEALAHDVRKLLG